MFFIICGVSFGDKGNLTKHIAAVHHGVKREMWKTMKLTETFASGFVYE